MDKVKEITDIAESLGWCVSVNQEGEHLIFDFQCYTPHGQDFSFEVYMFFDDIDTLIAGMEQFYESFDPDYEAYLWIAEDGHGRRGAPYHIKDIVEDMEYVESKIDTLLNTIGNKYCG